MRTTLLLIGALLLAACENSGTKTGGTYADTTVPEDTTTTVGEMSPQDTVFYTMSSFDMKSKTCQSDTHNCARFYATFPLVEGRLHGKITDSVNNFIRRQLYSPLIGTEQANGINVLLAPYYEEYNKAMAEAAKEGQSYIPAWWFRRTFTVVNNANGIFSIAHSEKSFAGGPHPNSFTVYYHFNSVTGRRIHVNDIIKPGTEGELSRIVEKKFRKKMKLPAKDSLQNLGYLREFYVPDNFNFKDDGIIFRYNEGEIAPFTSGHIEILVAYTEVQNILRDEFNPLLPEDKKVKMQPIARN